MISSGYRFIYLHVPKTGGNSIQTALLPFSDDARTQTRHQDGVERFGIVGPVTPRKHATLQEYEDRQPGVSRDHRLVLSVRHPVDRAISAYFSPHRWLAPVPEGGYRPRPPVWSEQDFLAMLTHEVPPMADYLRLNGRIRPADHLLRHERLAADFSAAAEALGLPDAPGLRLGHVNRSAGSAALRDRLRDDPRIRNMVEARYAEDMALFGYAVRGRGREGAP